MSESKNKILAAKTAKARKMDVLEFNRRENLSVAQEYRWGEKRAPYVRDYAAKMRERAELAEDLRIQRYRARMLAEHGFTV